MAEPNILTVGDSWVWTQSFSDYLSTDGYALTYEIVNASAQISIAASGVADGTYSVDVPAATTAAYTAGEYSWAAFVTKATDRFTVASGTFEIKPNFAAGAVDARSDVKKTLDALDAMILGKASKDQISYSINGRSISRLSPQELIDWRDYYRKQYADELSADQVAAGKRASNRILVSF